MKKQKQKQKLMIWLGYILLIAAAYLTTQTEGANPSVTLTVEGRESLVGEQCPGIVKISCYGVDLSVIRWQFNGNTDVITFFSDNVIPSPFTNNPAFLNAELLSTTQDPVDPNFANFSSELVVDVSQLQTESINSIACGDLDTFKMIPIAVEIIQETEPESPNGTNVTALYEDGSLTDLIISWEKLEIRCPEFQSSSVYQVTLLGSSVVAVNHTSCGQVCIVSFQNFSNDSEEYRVSLYAVNAIGTSEVVEYPTTIVKQSSFYFTPNFLSNDCLFACECFSNASLDTDSCSVLYTTDSMYMNPSTIIVSPLNTRFEITGITSNTVYYFEFSVSVNETLLVRNRLTDRVISSPRLSVLVIVFLALTILAIILEAVLGTVLGVLRELNGFPAIVFFGACILGTVSFIFLIVFSIIIGVQEDTCSVDWIRARDALIIVAFSLALSGNIFLVCFLLASSKQKSKLYYDFQPTVNSIPISESGNMDLEHSPRHSQGNIHRSDHADSPKNYQKNNSWSSRLTNVIQVIRNNQETIELEEPKASSQSITSSEKSALGRPKKIEDSKGGIGDATAETSTEVTKNTKANSESTKTTSKPINREQKCSRTKQGEFFTFEAKNFTVYKVVVRLKDRSYFVFRRYTDFKDLFDKIKMDYPSVAKKMNFPWQIHLVGNFNPGFIKQRRIELHKFIVNVMKIPELLEFLQVQEFLAIDNPRLGIPIYDNETIDEPTDGGKVEKVELGDKENATMITDFDLLKVIGIGTFGKVYLSRHKVTGALNAIKVLQKEKIVKCSKVKHIMAKRNNTTHPFLVGLHYSFQTSTNLYFVLDYVNGGTLFFHLQREKVFNESRARFYAAEITSALGYLHKHSIIYWDLKIENILLDANGHIILTDFGLREEKVKFGDKSHRTTMICGTPECPAPEVLSKQEYSYSVDWWCLGVVTYEMMYGVPPFYSQEVAQMRDNILHKPLQLHSHITSNAQNLLKELLQKDKEARLGSGIGGDEDITAHPFFRSINMVDLPLKPLEPPFKPRVMDSLDLQQFDSKFTVEAGTSPHSYHGTVDVPSVSIAENTFNVKNYI